MPNERPARDRQQVRRMARNSIERQQMVQTG